MMKADEAKKITNEAIEKRNEEKKRVMEDFLVKAEEKIKEAAEKGDTTCYINAPKEYEYSEYKVLDTFREYGYGAQFECFNMIRLTW